MALFSHVPQTRQGHQLPNGRCLENAELKREPEICSHEREENKSQKETSDQNEKELQKIYTELIMGKSGTY